MIYKILCYFCGKENGTIEGCTEAPQIEDSRCDACKAIHGTLQDAYQIYAAHVNFEYIDFMNVYELSERQGKSFINSLYDKYPDKFVYGLRGNWPIFQKYFDEYEAGKQIQGLSPEKKLKKLNVIQYLYV